MARLFRLTPVIAGSLVLTGCITAATTISGTQKLVSAAPIQIEFTMPTTPVAGVTPVFWSPTTAAGHEKEYLGYLLIDSGQKCQEFADHVSTAQRGVDTSFDILSGVLSALATAFTPLATVHALTAAATISTATKSAINADIYAKATATLILNQINNTYYADVRKYREDLRGRIDTVVPALEISDIEAIHRECSLDAAIASLSQAGAAGKASAAAAAGAREGAMANPSNPTAGAIAGAAIGAAAGAGGAASVAPTEAAAKQGAAAAAAVVTPPAAVAPSDVPAPPAAAPTSGSKRSSASASHRPPSEPPCQQSEPQVACPASVAPEISTSVTNDIKLVRKLGDVVKLHALALALGVATPVPTVRCMRRDIINKIDQTCTDDQRQQLERVLVDQGVKK